MLTRLVIHIKILFQLFRLIPNLKRKILKESFYCGISISQTRKRFSLRFPISIEVIPTEFGSISSVQIPIYSHGIPYFDKLHIYEPPMHRSKAIMVPLGRLECWMKNIRTTFYPHYYE